MPQFQCSRLSNIMLHVTSDFVGKILLFLIEFNWPHIPKFFIKASFCFNFFDEKSSTKRGVSSIAYCYCS